MSKDATSTAPERKPLEWFEENIPVRGCKLTIQKICDVYSELNRINNDFGEKLVPKLVKFESMSDEDWEDHKKFLLRDAFKLTVSITGYSDERIYDEDVDIFTSKNVPNQIKKIYFTNITAFSRNAKGEKPANLVEVSLDFGKPDLIDPNIIVSAATPNNSYVRIIANDISFFRAVQQVVDSKLTSRGTWYRILHKQFAYDLGLWVLALPLALFFATFYTDRLFPFGSDLALYKWPFFVYAVGMMLLVYRFLSSYAKWAFPVNILVENKDSAWKHRVALGAISSWLTYKLVDTIYGLIVSISI